MSMAAPVRPWRWPLMRALFLPSSVLGPVDFMAFRRLAKSCFRDTVFDMVVVSSIAAWHAGGWVSGRISVMWLRELGEYFRGTRDPLAELAGIRIDIAGTLCRCRFRGPAKHFRSVPRN